MCVLNSAAHGGLLALLQLLQNCSWPGKVVPCRLHMRRIPVWFPHFVEIV
jgi:hypothetical protein